MGLARGESNEKYGSGATSPLNAGGRGSGATNRRSKSKLWWIIGAIVAIVIVLGAVLGGVLGSRAANHNSKSNSVGASNDNSDTGKKGGSTNNNGVTTSNDTHGAVSGSTFTTTDLPAWNWAQNKAAGMCLGSWLILEKWMVPDWFNATVNAVTPGSGATTLDEWSFCQLLGQDKCEEALVQHFDTFVTESDIETLHQNGINQLRIPTGYWAWIPTIEGEPYLNRTDIYQFYINRVLSWAYDRGMYAILDMHGVPGSQNGEQSSGHLTTTPSFFGGDANTETASQLRSDEMIKAVIEFVENSPYRSVITGIEPVNEPRPYTPDQLKQLENYFERSYQAIQASTWPVATIITNGYTNLSYWYDFTAAHATNPPSMVMVDHPYPGNFPPQNNSANILSQVCTAATRYLEYPVPICIDEWSIYTGVKDQSFEKTFYEQQLVTWAWSAGGFYWSYKLQTSQQDLANGLDYSQYSWSTLLANNSATIPKPSDYGINGTNSAANADAFISALQGELTSSCGTVPSDVSPFSNGSFPVSSWTVEQNARTSAQGKTLTGTSTSLPLPTSTSSSTVTARVKRRATPLRN
ncbi:glycoside hydrolase family 5 protein [Sporobolomyces koalae]|uniref:glycoside hydrolase family 5 protein n=1 Tax=Sporobolomyces koalae TaxID=500713 RepID=UPI003172FE28